MNKKLKKMLALAALSLGLMAGLTACEGKEEEPNGGGNPSVGFSIDDQYLNHTINKEKKTIEIPVNVPASTSKWFVETDANWIFASKENAVNGIGKVILRVDENNSGATRDAIVTVSSTARTITVNVRQYAESGLIVAGDFPVKPISATASSQQSNGHISLSYDDDVNTIYHSSWSGTTFPVELKYNFAGREQIDYIEYVPRQGGGNGSFEEFELYVAEDAAKSNFEKIGDFNFHGSSAPSQVTIPGGKKPTCVKFSVKSGVGNFASCAEMRFFRYNTESSLDRELLEVFTDLTCSELKPGVTSEQIQQLDPAFQLIAEALMNGTYDPLEKSFRIHEYEAYSNPVEWAEPLMTKIYSNWDNPMGIAVKKGEKVLILVGETHGNSLSVQILGEEGSGSELRPQKQGTFHSLRPGVNQIEADQEGQLFLMYTAVPSAATSKPIKVHIPLGQGSFAGYWRLSEHKTDEKFTEIVGRGTHKYFCIVGNRMLLYFNRQKLPRKIVDPITQWDNIITWQQNFMGIEDVRPSLWNNHIAGVSSTVSSDYMWASDYTMCFHESTIEKIMGLDRLNANADNAWGPAHEMGHVNQKAINWASTTESSNNLFSNYVLYRFGRYNSRGRGLYYRFKAVYEQGHSWASMLNTVSTGPEIPKVADGQCFDGTGGEDTGIHMRLNWQLWNYYHRVLKDEKFFGRVFQNMRKLGMTETENCGKKQLEFAVACSEAAGEDLTDFFEAWGFFKAHNSVVSQYGTYDYKVTQAMIENAKMRMSKYPKPKHALEYIEDRSVKMGAKPGDYSFDMVGDLGYYTTYEQNLKVSSNAKATVSGRSVTTTNCENAVAIEVRKRLGESYGEIRYASNYVQFTVPTKVDINGCNVYAVQADGTRIFLAQM
ncbi:MAG: M60 family metallopeptidase [Muribaculaceae bacterium]|nr:M60 family metallopeptidase [Muribaculaceae bacterium]